MAQEALANPGPKRRGTAPAPHGARRWEGAAHRGAVLLGWGQWSIHGRRWPTLMRHEVGEAAVERGGLTSCPLSLTPPLAPAA